MTVTDKKVEMQYDEALVDALDSISEFSTEYALKLLEEQGFSIVRTSTLRDTRNGVYNLRTDKDVD